MLLEKCEVELEQDHRAQRLQEDARLSFEKLCAFHGVSDPCDITVDWIFSSRIQSVGLEPISGDILVVGRGWHFLRF